MKYQSEGPKRRRKDCVDKDLLSHSKSEELEINRWEKGRMGKTSEEGSGPQRVVMQMLWVQFINRFFL
ncbi:hypothetical protein TNCV_2545391 [Trichonephila clavipes]|nr:hypothetical protein TNCV_2545391 [Trichonephila clavipes]